MAFANWLNNVFGKGSGVDNALKWFDENVLFGTFGKMKIFSNGINGVMKNLGDYIPSYLDSVTGAHMTGAEREAFDLTAQREDTTYQRTVADMQAAGLNPMMLAGGAHAVQSSPAQSSGGDPSALLSLLMLPQQMKLNEAQINNLNASAEEKRSKAPYWTQRIKESEKKIESMQAGIDKDIAIAGLNKAKTMTETELLDYRIKLLEAQSDLATMQANETDIRANLELAQKIYQEALNDNNMAEKVCAKIVAEANLAGAQASREQENALSIKLANAMIRGDFVQVAEEQLKENGHYDDPDIKSKLFAILKNALNMISISVGGKL